MLARERRASSKVASANGYAAALPVDEQVRVVVLLGGDAEGGREFGAGIDTAARSHLVSTPVRQRKRVTLANALKRGRQVDNSLGDDVDPGDLNVYRYMGSLTTPPCSEGVNWHVADRPVEASAAQIAALREALGPTARSLQPRGNRLVVAPAE